MRKFVFIHLPKTAGSSLRVGLCDVFGTDNVTSTILPSRMTEEEAEALDRYRVICGHISAEDVRRHFADRTVLTILREPVARCVSWYYFARMQPNLSIQEVAAAHEHDIEGFFSLDRRIIHRNIFNRQTRQLGGHVLDLAPDLDLSLENAFETLRTCAWVGRQDQLDADLQNLVSAFPEFANLAVGRVNITGGKPPQDDIPPRVIEKIVDLNRFDLKLYEAARFC